MFCADTVDRELMVAVITDLVGILAQQHVDHIGRAKALASSVNSRHELLRRLGSIPGRRRVQAVVAVTAGLWVLVAEISE